MKTQFYLGSDESTNGPTDDGNHHICPIIAPGKSGNMKRREPQQSRPLRRA